VRAALPAEAPLQPVTFEVLARTGDSSRTQPGVPRGLRRTGELRTRSMPVFDRFVPSLTVRQPFGYLIDAGDTALVARLWRHGIHAAPAGTGFAAADEFVVDSIGRATRTFQGHNEVRIVGRWRRTERVSQTGLLSVPVAGPLAALVVYLLDPESDDSFATWNQLDDRLRVGQPYPVLRIVTPPAR